MIKWYTHKKLHEFYLRFKNLVNTLGFPKIQLQQNYQDAADLILKDKKHLDNNPNPISKQVILTLLKQICS